MVDVMGHIAMGALWAIPAWFLWSERVALTFIGLTLVTSPLPDIDLWINKVFPGLVHHHGVTHTVVFVFGVSLLAALVAAVLLTGPVDRWLNYDRFDRMSMFMFAFLAFLLGGLSHLFADMLSAPDIAQPIEPFWPFFDKPWSVDALWYNDPVWNLGLLVVAVLVHVALAAMVDPVEHRGRIVRR